MSDTADSFSKQREVLFAKSFFSPLAVTAREQFLKFFISMQFTQFSRGIFQLHVLPKAQTASTDADCEQGMQRNAESQEKSECERANSALGEFVPTCPYFYQQSFWKLMHCRGGFLAISGQDFLCPLARDLHLQMWLPPVPAAWTPAPSLHQEASSCYHVSQNILCSLRHQLRLLQNHEILSSHYFQYCQLFPLIGFLNCLKIFTFKTQKATSCTRRVLGTQIWHGDLHPVLSECLWLTKS